jgi:hypothetical protein
MRRQLFVLLAALLLMTFPGEAHAEPSCSWCEETDPVRPGGDGITVSDAGGVPGSPGGDGPGAPVVWRPGGPVYRYSYAPACARNLAGFSATGGFVEAVRCAAAATCPDPGQLRVLVARRVAGPPPGAWQRVTGTVCLTAAQRLPYDPAAVHGFAGWYLRQLPLPAPGLRVQPVDTLVNLPTIFSAERPPSGRFTVSEPPFPTIRITATPRWRWGFGDGGTAETATPGRPFDGTLPADRPGHYVTHTYTEPGVWPAVVTTVWTATYTVAGLAGEFPMPGAVTRSSSAAVNVGEGHAVLVDNR